MARDGQRADDAERLRQAKFGAFEYGEKEPEAAPESQASLVERRILEGLAAGAFADLPGHGKPLNLSTNPHLDPAMALAYHLLGNAGCAPEWIERGKELEKRIAEARATAARAVFDGQLTATGERRLAEDLAAINRQIDDDNIAVPIPSQRRARLRLEDEVRRAVATR